MKLERVYAIKFAGLYPMYVKKVESKGRTQAELDEVIRWLTGYSQQQLDQILASDIDLQTFYAQAKLNPARELITGTVCGVKLAEIAEPLMKEIRYLDKLVDELAKGRPLEKILRK